MSFFFSLILSVTTEPVETTQYITRYKDDVVRIKVSGHPAPTVVWKKDGLTIDLNADRYQVLADGSLQIRNVTLSDEGSYTAYISQLDTEGKTTEIIHVFVKGMLAPFHFFIFLFIFSILRMVLPRVLLFMVVAMPAFRYVVNYLPCLNVHKFNGLAHRECSKI